MNEHDMIVENIAGTIASAFKCEKRLQFKKNSTNTIRPPNSFGNDCIDLRILNRILSIDGESNSVDVEPAVPMDALVRFCLKYGYVPPVVPEFPGITVGGAIQGGALESSSFRYGQFNDIVLELELLLGDGTRIVATANNEYADLFWGVSTSYGSLAIITRAKLRLIHAEPYVNLTLRRFDSPNGCKDAIFSTVAAANPFDFIEGLVLSESFSVGIFGALGREPLGNIRRFKRNIDPWYYRFVAKAVDAEPSFSVPLEDYLFRYDKGGFWMGEYVFPIFGLSSNTVTRFLFAPFLHTRKLYDGLFALGRQQESVIQDLYLDKSDVESVFRFNAERSKIYPLWLCPIRSTTTNQRLSSHSRHKQMTLLNVGIYGKPESGDAISATRDLEHMILASGKSRKMLYALTLMKEVDFWRSYDKDWYERLRDKYHAKTFTDIHKKIFSDGSAPRQTFSRGLAILIFESLRGKNVVWW